MGRILIDVDGDQVTVHRADDTGAPEEVIRRAAEIGAISAGAAPAPPGRAKAVPAARALFDAGRPRSTGRATRSASKSAKPSKKTTRGTSRGQRSP